MFYSAQIESESKLIYNIYRGFAAVQKSRKILKRNGDYTQFKVEREIEFEPLFRIKRDRSYNRM